MACGIPQAELLNHSFMENGDINDCLSSGKCSGIMGVPITYMFQHCPEQFEIIWQASGNAYANAPEGVMEELKFDPTIKYGGGLGAAVIDGKAVYSRILIRRKDF